jgi:hypothetical protein
VTNNVKLIPYSLVGLFAYTVAFCQSTSYGKWLYLSDTWKNLLGLENTHEPCHFFRTSKRDESHIWGEKLKKTTVLDELE